MGYAAMNVSAGRREVCSVGGGIARRALSDGGLRGGSFSSPVSGVVCANQVERADE